MRIENKATSLWSNILKLNMPQVRAFHMSWFAFFLCFFAWFGIAPLMHVIREDLQLTKSEIGWSIIASVAATVFARLFVGWLCDRVGPRLTYTWLLILGSLPVMAIGFAQDAWTFIFFRLLIGMIGASFVVTQYHTSIMFAPNVVGTANATSAGWGNLGGGVTQMIMPLIFAGLVSVFSLSAAWGWRLSMVVAGLVCMLTGFAYYLFTQDAPNGNFKELRAKGELGEGEQDKGAFWKVCQDRRVWALFVIYAACFGMELTINNIAVLYFLDYFEYFQHMTATDALKAAGLIAALFGLTNSFARTAGGAIGDAFGQRWGLGGRVHWLFLAVFCEGLALMLFSQMQVLALAIPVLMLFSVCVQSASGATYCVVPFINKKAMGSVAGIVGAGGNAGAVAAGFLFQGFIAWPTALLILGGIATSCSFAAFAVTFSPEEETEARKEAARSRAKELRSRETDSQDSGADQDSPLLGTT
ncbi:MAG: MFS transporter [Planctomycetales bacterium]